MASASILLAQLPCRSETTIASFDELLPKTAADFCDRGLVRSRVGDLTGALEDFDQAIKLDDHYAEAYSGRGYLSIYNGDNQTALVDFNRAIELDENNTAAYCGRGQAKSALGKEEEALADFNHAVKLDSNKAQSYIFRGYHLSSNGDKTKALADFDQTIKLDPKNALAYCYRGLAREAVKDKKGAIADFEQVIKFDPEYAWAWYRRGQVRDEVGDRKGAMSDFNRYIKLQPADPWGFRARGFTLHESGNRKAAIADYTKAISLEPGDPWTFSARGFERSLIGDTKGAIQDYKEAARLERKKATDAAGASTISDTTRSDSAASKVELVKDSEIYKFSESAFLEARKAFGKPTVPIKQVLLFHRPGPHCQTVMMDADKGIFCIFIANELNDNYIHGNLGHEVVHLLNAKLCDPYIEGLCSVFGEERLSLEGDGKQKQWRAAFEKLLMQTPFYKETYLMMKEIKAAIARERYNQLMDFAVFDQTGDWMHIDIDKWLSTLDPSDREQAIAIIDRYADSIDKTMPKGATYVFAKPASKNTLLKPTDD